MTVVLDDRITMAGIDHEPLDELFDQLEPTPEGFRVEIVEGAVHMVPQRDVHWQIILAIVMALKDQFGRDVDVKSDVRIDFPGHLNGYCPDVAMFREGAKPDGPDGKERWQYRDIKFIAEVISRGTAANDYGPKKAVYASVRIPAVLIVDPYDRKCHLYTKPQAGDYTIETTVSFGSEIDLSALAPGFRLATKTLPHD